MSLSYEFEKSIILGLIATAISLILGLVILLNPFAHGFIDPEQYRDRPDLYDRILNYNELELLVKYCYEHASESLNPVQDVVDKIIITWGWFNGENCVTVKQSHDAYLRQVPPT
jgi:hypothetical protein